MRKGIAILGHLLVILGFIFIIYCVWMISPWKPNHETDPFGAMIAVYFWGFPALIILGILLLLAKKPLQLSWRSGLIPLIYAVPYSLELILKENRLAPYAYHKWWKAHVYPWTDWFLVMTALITLVYIVSCAIDILRAGKRKNPEPAGGAYVSPAAGDPSAHP